jgi:hypothetical protein
VRDAAICQRVANEGHKPSLLGNRAELEFVVFDPHVERLCETVPAHLFYEESLEIKSLQVLAGSIEIKRHFGLFTLSSQTQRANDARLLALFFFLNLTQAILFPERDGKIRQRVIRNPAAELSVESIDRRLFQGVTVDVFNRPSEGGRVKESALYLFSISLQPLKGSEACA